MLHKLHRLFFLAPALLWFGVLVLWMAVSQGYILEDYFRNLIFRKPGRRELGRSLGWLVGVWGVAVLLAVLLYYFGFSPWKMMLRAWLKPAAVALVWGGIVIAFYRQLWKDLSFWLALASAIVLQMCLMRAMHSRSGPAFLLAGFLAWAFIFFVMRQPRSEAG